MSKIKKNMHPVKKIYSSPFQIYWIKENYLFLIVGIFLLILGFYLMSIGNWDNPVSLIVSPIVLTISYLLILPTSIFYRKKKDKSIL